MWLLKLLLFELNNKLICSLNVHVHYKRGQWYQEMIITPMENVHELDMKN